MAKDAMSNDLDPSLWRALAQREDETARAHAAFLDYVRMGAGRSLNKLYKEYRDQSGAKAGPKKRPTQRLNTLKDWSAKYQWQTRLEAYQKERDPFDQKLWEERRHEVRETGWETGDKLLKLAESILEQTPQFLKTTRRIIRGGKGEPDREVITIAIASKEMLEAFKLALEMKRQAAEVKPPAQQVELTQPVPIQFVRAGRQNQDGDAGDTDDTKA